MRMPRVFATRRDRISAARSPMPGEGQRRAEAQPSRAAQAKTKANRRRHRARKRHGYQMAELAVSRRWNRRALGAAPPHSRATTLRRHERTRSWDGVLWLTDALTAFASNMIWSQTPCFRPAAAARLCESSRGEAGGG